MIDKVLCPPGEAYGSHELRTRGNRGWPDAEGSRMSALKKKQGESRCKVIFGDNAIPVPEESLEDYWIRAWSQA